MLFHLSFWSDLEVVLCLNSSIELGPRSKEKGLTFNRVEHDCGLGNGTIKRWGDQSPRLDKLVRVSEYLDVSLDYLVFGTLHSENSPSGEIPDLRGGKSGSKAYRVTGARSTKWRQTLSPCFRLLPSSEKEDLFDLVYFKYKSTLRKDGVYLLDVCRRERRRKKRPFPGP